MKERVRERRDERMKERVGRDGEKERGGGRMMTHTCISLPSSYVEKYAMAPNTT